MGEICQAENKWLESIGIDARDHDWLTSARLDFCCLLADDEPWPSFQWWWKQYGQEWHAEEGHA